jgi:DNA repair protein RadC
LDLQSKLRRLNDRKENLEERLQKTGAAALLDTELNAALLATQVVEINTYVTAITTRKGEL